MTGVVRALLMGSVLTALPGVDDRLLAERKWGQLIKETGARVD